MADLPAKNAALPMKITGADEEHQVDVKLIDGVNYMQVFGVQAIESLRGLDTICDVWFYIGTENDSVGAGNIGDTVRVQIAAGDNPVAFPGIDLTYTLVAEDVGNEEALATNIAAFLNLDNTFKELWRAQKISNSGVVYITARKPGSQFERPNVNDFVVTSTGDTVVTRAFDKIIRQNKITSLARDPADPRIGILGITGSVVQTEGDVTGRFQVTFDNLAIDGSVTPQNFRIEADPTEVKFISSINISGRDNGIQFARFLGINTPLSNGIVVSFKSNDFMATRAPIKTTDDFLDIHAEDPDNFVVYFASGADKFSAILTFSTPLEIRPSGEFVLDDYLQITVQDNLTSVSQLRCIVNGFNREF